MQLHLWNLIFKKPPRDIYNYFAVYTLLRQFDEDKIDIELIVICCMNILYILHIFLLGQVWCLVFAWVFFLADAISSFRCVTVKRFNASPKLFPRCVSSENTIIRKKHKWTSACIYRCIAYVRETHFKHFLNRDCYSQLYDVNSLQPPKWF